MLGLCCCTQAFSSCGGQGLLFAFSSCYSRVSHRCVFSCCRAQAPGCGTSVVAAGGLSSCGSRLSCHATSGIFLDQGSNPCLLYWWVDSLPLAPPLAPSHVHNSAQITRTRDFTGETEPALSTLQHPSPEREQGAAGCLCHQRHDQSHSSNQDITEEWDKCLSKRCEESHTFC